MSEERWKENAKEHAAMFSDIATLKSDVSAIKVDTSEIRGKISILQPILISIAGSVGLSLIILILSWAWKILTG